MSAASLIATHLNAPYGPVVTEGDVAESLRRGVPSARTPEANAILEALFVECEASLIERAAAELGVPLRVGNGWLDPMRWNPDSEPS